MISALLPRGMSPSEYKKGTIVSLKDEKSGEDKNYVVLDKKVGRSSVRFQVAELSKLPKQEIEVLRENNDFYERYERSNMPTFDIMA